MKKVLIITYYWPPAGGPGVQRWLKFVKYLPEFDIEPIVYCPKNPTYPTADPSLCNEISKQLKVLKQPISEPLGFLNRFLKSKANTLSKGLIPTPKKQSFLIRLLLFIRGNFFIPDARVLWVKPSVKFLSNYISKHQIDTIITTGPPHSVHLIGLGLKSKHSLKWFADFRDPWTAIGYHNQLKLSKSSQKKHLALESKVLKSSDHIIVTAPRTKQILSGISKQPISVITNGFDEISNTRVEMDTMFTLTHVGMLTPQRNPNMLWEVLFELTQELTHFKDKFKLVLIGNISKEVLDIIGESGLEPYLENKGIVPHRDAVLSQKASQVLLLIEADTDTASYIIPAKLFEYLNSGRPIVAMGPKPSDVESILNDTAVGAYFDYRDKDRLKVHIAQLFKSYETKSISIKPKQVQHYSRRVRTQVLARLLTS